MSESYNEKEMYVWERKTLSCLSGKFFSSEERSEVENEETFLWLKRASLKIMMSFHPITLQAHMIINPRFLRRF
jgi:hypothetical protein